MIKTIENTEKAVLLNMVAEMVEKRLHLLENEKIDVTLDEEDGYLQVWINSEISEDFSTDELLIEWNLNTNCGTFPHHETYTSKRMYIEILDNLTEIGSMFLLDN